MHIRQKIGTVLLTVLIMFVTIPSRPCDYYRQERLDYALIRAIRANDTSAALTTLKAGANPNTRTYYWNNADQLPFELEHVLNLHDPDANTQRESRYTPLSLLLDLSVSRNDTDFPTLRFHSSRNRNIVQEDTTLVRVLLDAGADPNLTVGKEAGTPLFWACLGNHPQTLRLMLQRGGNPRLKDRSGWTALHWAARYNNAEGVSLLLHAGADINAQNDRGQTPLYWACYGEHLQAVQMLLRHHANPNLRDKDGKTALDMAIGSENLTQREQKLDPLELAILKDKTQIIKLLRKAGAKTGKELSSLPSP